MIETQGQARRVSPALSEPEVALHLLAEEMITYRDHLPGLLQGQQGQYVLIKGTNVVGVFRDRSEALRERYQRFGIVPFLVRQIVACEPVVYLPNCGTLSKATTNRLAEVEAFQVRLKSRSRCTVARFLHRLMDRHPNRE